MRLPRPENIHPVIAGLALVCLLSLTACQQLTPTPRTPDPQSGGGTIQPPPTGARPVPADGRLYLYALDVGQGDGMLIISPRGKTILIDAGPTEAGDNIVATLTKRGVSQLDLVIATHPHADHIGGMRQVMAAFPVRKFLDSGQAHSTGTWGRTLTEIQQQGIEFVRATKGQKIVVEPGLAFDVLHPGTQKITEVRGGGSVVNANSIVLRLEYGNFSMLFTGDAEFETEAMLMNQRVNLKAKFLKVGHHGSRHATSGKFLETIAPKVAIISDGANNEYGHPGQATLDRLRRARVELFRTDMHGEIVIATDGRTVDVKPTRAARDTDIWLGRQPVLNELAANP
ncbi:MAG: ComEC/Rec2 family competence protein [Blastocatellia bacterium]